jgi:hypothetical protein
MGVKCVNLKCGACNKSFLKAVKYYNYLLKKGNQSFYCSKECCIRDKSSKKISSKCLHCGAEFITSDRHDAKKCCCSECAHKYSQSFVDPETQSDIAKKSWEIRKLSFVYKTQTKRISCIICNNNFVGKIGKTCCSEACSKIRRSVLGRKSAELQRETRRSKNEIAFANLCKTAFQNVQTNERIFNGWDADVILPNEKIAVLWNGNWHFKKITQLHSVQQVINREKIKIDEIRKMGYTPYIVEDRGRYNLSFVRSEFKKFRLFIENGCIV